MVSRPFSYAEQNGYLKILTGMGTKPFKGFVPLNQTREEAHSIEN